MTFEFIMTWVFGLVVGLILGFLGCRYLMKKQMQSHPSMVITDDMLKAMLSGAGQTPTPKRLKAIRKQMEIAAKK